MVLMPSEPTPALLDAVRIILVGFELRIYTIDGMRRHCEASGVDTSTWPDWTRGDHVGVHLNKRMQAALLYHEFLKEGAKTHGH
jgi:hypothetical protein